MGSSWKLGRIAGIDVYLHWSLPLILLYVAWVSRDNSQNFLPLAIGMVLLFVCVALHEFGHSFAARFFGIQTKRIMLAVVGGVAMFERGVEKPSQQVVVFAAGPIVNLVLGLLFGAIKMAFLAGLGLDPLQGAPVDGLAAFVNTILYFLALGNLILAIFNLLPILPLDGGHILRSFCCWILGVVWGTRISRTISMAVLLLYLLLTIGSNDIFLFLMGAFFLTTNLAMFPSFTRFTTKLFSPTRHALMYGPQALAKKGYDQQLLSMPDSMNLHLHNALASFQVGEHQQSSYHADYLLPRDPHCYEAYRLRVMNTGAHHPISFGYIERLKLLKPQNEHTAFMLGNLASYEQDPDLAFSYFQQELSFNPHANNSKLQSLMAVIAGSQYNPQAIEYAAQQLAWMIEQNPYELDFYYHQGLVALYQQQFDLANKAANTLVKLDSSYTYGFELLGRVALNHGDLAQSIAYFRHAANLYNGYSSSLLTGLALDLQGDHQAAEAEWTNFMQGLRRAEATFSRLRFMPFEPSLLPFFAYAIPRFGNEAFLLEAYGDELVRHNQLEQALEVYLRAKQEYFLSDHLHYKLGLCYHRLAQHDDAIRQFELALHQDRNLTHQRWAKHALETYQQKDGSDASSTQDSPSEPEQESQAVQ